MRIETPRQSIRRLTPDDAPFILELLNDPAFLRYIGDKGVRTLEDARNYILAGPVASYEQFGFGLYLVQLKESGASIGMCGLLKRDRLPHPDIGFAFLPQFRSMGYGREAAQAVLADARAAHGLTYVLAIASPDNDASIALLEKMGFRFERFAALAEGEPDVKLFALALLEDPA